MVHENQTYHGVSPSTKFQYKTCHLSIWISVQGQTCRIFQWQPHLNLPPPPPFFFSHGSGDTDWMNGSINSPKKAGKKPAMKIYWWLQFFFILWGTVSVKTTPEMGEEEAAAMPTAILLMQCKELKTSVLTPAMVSVLWTHDKYACMLVMRGSWVLGSWHWPDPIEPIYHIKLF